MPIYLPLSVAPGTPILRGFDFLWAQIREAGRNGRAFTAAEIDRAGNDPDSRAASAYLRRLVAGGIAEVVGTGPVPTNQRGLAAKLATLYRLVHRPVETPHLRRDGTPVTGSGRQQGMWNAMRALGSFTATELAVTATTEERPVTVVYAGHYARALAAAGYLAAAGRPPTYRLKPAMNSGPKAPMLLAARLVYDPNRRAVAEPVVAEEIAS